MILKQSDLINSSLNQLPKHSIVSIFSVLRLRRSQEQVLLAPEKTRSGSADSGDIERIAITYICFGQLTVCIVRDKSFVAC